MSQEEPRPKLRVALASFPERYDLPLRPASAPPGVQDAHRQTQFLLGSDLALLERAMNLQLALVAAAAKERSPQATGLLALWSRAFAYLADACTLMCRGSYVSCPPLLRTACDCIAAQRSLLAEEFGEYAQWLEHALAQDREHAALAVDLGRFRAGSVLAQDERLGALYRLLTDLSMPHFGATAVQVAPDSTLQRMGLAFADNAFHLGWAELVSGWLLALVRAQLETVVGSGVLPVADEARHEYDRLGSDIQSALANPRRCHVREAEDRFVFHNFRRAASGQPKRLVLG